MTQFSVSDYSRQVQQVLDVDRLCELGPGSANRSARDSLSALEAESIGTPPQTVVDREMAMCCVAGLWLWNDFLDESHTISQDIPSTTGSYWHGIMHRREPDFSNGKYWFRRAGDHPIFEPLCNATRQLVAQNDRAEECAFLATQTSWDPFRFVDLCEATIRGRSPDEDLCRQVARLEWQLLFDFCYRRAVGD